MVKAAIAVLLASALSACSTAKIAPQAGPPPVQSEPATAPAISLADIAGQWDVVSFEGYEPVRMHGTVRAAVADFSEHGIQLRIECNTSRSGGAYSIANGRLVQARGLRMQTEMGCGHEREERDRRYFSFFDRSPTVDRLPNGRLRFVAGDSVLILERPEQRRLAFVPDLAELAGRWQMQALTRYERGGGHSGIGLSDVPGRIVIEANRLKLDSCPQHELAFRYSSDGRLMKTDGPPIPDKPVCPALNFPDYEAPALPSAIEIIALLHSNPWVEDVGGGHLLIANERFGLLLARPNGSR